ncbi:MAG TPA: FKBP-type peptidyl-prolyl cis-trans isomerase, partial [Pelovirga sp.]|nr:FKBP-type peptidyl-prolyl cis-trans isomerase [Pelovirga sp.]
IFDSRDSDDPLTFVVGDGTLFPALEQEICSMHCGQTKNILIPTEKAYGPRKNANLIRVERSQFPPDKTPEPGRLVTITFSDGEQRIMRVINCDDHGVTLDANHPLAGLDLTFALTLVAIED